MYYGFDTDSELHGKAALLLYAMYRSRDEKSPLNGLKTWDLCNRNVRRAVLKSTTTAEFVQEFCKLSMVEGIKPNYLKTDGLVEVDDFGTLALVKGTYNYQADIYENQEILDLFENESLWIIILVRMRIQGEKEVFNNED